MQAIAGKAVCFGQALKPEFSRYAHQVVANCKVLASELSEAGMRLVSGGTDNHMVLVDVTPLGITGQQAEQTLESVGIIANKNAIPFDTKPPRVTSGLRLGAPAITSRGFDEAAVQQVAALIVKILTNMDNEPVQREVAVQVKELTSHFPVPGLDM